MNWRLIRYSPTWRTAAWASPIYALLWLMLSQGGRIGVAMTAPFLVWIGHVLMAAREPQVSFRCTFFEAALPIPGRQLWLSKKIISLGLIWLPVLVASAVGFAVLRDPALPLLQATAGYTVILLFATGFGLQQFHEPKRICYTSLIVGGSAMMVIARTLPNSAWVLAAYLLTSAVLFVVTWRRVPSSFQIASTELAAIEPMSAGVSSRSPVWWRILRPVYLAQLVLVVLSGLVWWVAGMQTLVLYLGSVLVVIATKLRWRYLAHLPVSSRTFFRAAWAPYALPILVNYEAALRIRDFRTVTTVLVLGLALLLALVFSFHAPDWRRFRKVPVALRWIAIMVPLGIGSAWPDYETWHNYGNDPVPYLALQLAGLLPANPWLLAAALLIPLAGLYWLAENAFCETEFVAVTRQQPVEEYQANFQR